MAILKSKSEHQKLELLITILWNTYLWPFREKFPGFNPQSSLNCQAGRAEK
ncbi:MAG: hypothetical protein AB9903_15730 [Vulcanimicrobiota bacterium]